MDDKKVFDPVAALREALERLRAARSQDVDDARLTLYVRDVDRLLETVIRQTRPRHEQTRGR